MPRLRRARRSRAWARRPPQGRGGAPAPPPAPRRRANPGAECLRQHRRPARPGGAPYQPWADELVKKRMADNSKDNPDAHCLPMGIMQLNSHPYPAQDHSDADRARDHLRRIGHDRPRDFPRRPRAAGKDAEPWWNGYSVGRWEGDTLVVETTGFMDDGWLDVRGSPLTSAGKMIERFRRTEVRQPRARSDDRRSEGVHAAVHREGHSQSNRAGHAADRVRVHRQGRRALPRGEVREVGRVGEVGWVGRIRPAAQVATTSRSAGWTSVNVNRKPASFARRGSTYWPVSSTSATSPSASRRIGPGTGISAGR